MEVKIIEISYADNEYLIRSQDHFLKSIFRGSLLECIGYAQVSKYDVINTEQVQQFFRDPEEQRNINPIQYGPNDISYTYGDGRPTLTELSKEKRRIEQEIRDMLTAFNEKYGTSVNSIELYNVDASTVHQKLEILTNVKINLDL